MKIRRVPLDGGRPKRPGQRPFHPSLDPRLLIWRAAFALPFVLIAFVSFGPLAVRATGPNILVNGGFEAGTPTDTAGVDRLPAGSTALTGWSVGPPASYPGSVDWTGSRWTAAEGTRSLELDGLPSEGAHSIYQDLTTVAGQTYDVTFQYSANPERFTPGPECGPNQNATPGVAVMWGGTQLGGAAVYYPATANSSAAMQWLSQSYRVAATATTTTLRFFSVDFPDRGCGLVLDDVAVVPASDFTISADPATVTMEQGTDAPVTISTGAVNATESIDFSVAVDSSGAAGSNGEDVIANVDPMTVTSGASATLAVHANLFAHTGTYIVTVTGTDTLGTAHATAVHVDVVAPGMTPSAPPTPSPDPTAAPTPTPTPTVAPTATPTPNTIQVPAGAGGDYPIDVIVPAVPPKADVLLAIDTTGSMGASIAQARADAQAIVTGVQGSVTDTQFAVVQFKDSSDTPEYQVVQAMTTSSAGITAALNGLSAGGGFDAPEAHNLVFQNSYTDPAIGWRTGTKKIVIVISDAEPHGAGAAANGLTGCADISADPHGLATATVLANMAAADRTLFMIRQAATASASLQCYQSVAARTGGSAVDGGTSTGALGSQIVTLINGAFTAATDLHVEVASATPSPASAIWISFVPPSIASVLTPSTQHFTVHVAVPAGTAAGSYTFDLKAVAGGADIGHQPLTVQVLSAAQDPAHQTVNTAADHDDGTCSDTDCTLREAITAADAHANVLAPDRIDFALGTGLQTINLTSALPVVTEAVVIDGGVSAVDPTCATGLHVELNGSAAPLGANGIELGATAGGSTIRRLQVDGFDGDGIRVTGASGVTVECNAITANHGNGIAVTGTATGVRIQANSIDTNGGLGIDLGRDGVTTNDTIDADTGPNALQNFPILGRAIPGAPGLIQGRINSTPNVDLSLSFYASDACDASGNGEGGGLVDGTTVHTDAYGDAFFALPTGVPASSFITAAATDAGGSTSELSPCLPTGPANDTWTRALPITPGDVAGYLDTSGQSRWFKFPITPGSQVQVDLSQLPANYDVALFKDIGQAYTTLTTPSDLTKLSAEFAPSQYSPSMFSPSQYSPSQFSPDAYAPSQFSPSQYSPSMFSPSQYSPSMFSPSQYSPSMFSPSQYSPSMFSPSQFSPSQYSPSQYSPSQFSADAFASAQVRSLIGVSAAPGTADESVISDTWNNTGSFYVRVSGRDGAFDLHRAFRLHLTQSAVTCSGIVPSGTAPAAMPAAGVKSVVLWDSSRIAGSGADIALLRSKLATFVARPEIAGAIIDLAADARVQALDAQADGNTGCPYAKNLAAYAIKDIVDAYRTNNPGLAYVVLVGGDRAVPFFRYADTALLGPESGYVPPVGPTTASEASLRLNYVLSQDAYGAGTQISLRAGTFPIPNLAVGRLVETASEASGMLDAYTSLTNGVVSTPTNALVSGYDFLADSAHAVANELGAGTGKAVGAGQPIDTLIEEGNLSPQDVTAWSASQLNSKLLGSRHDLIFLAGHFSANSALAADFTTSALTTDLQSSAVNLKNSIVFSAGCHSGYNIVDTDAINGVTLPLDWTQAFAQKGATLIAGTGYQYGDTDFIEYSERIYTSFAHELRVGSGPVSVGQALVRAKQDYLRQTVDIRGLHEKALLESTLFGLPMLSVDLPAAGRVAAATDNSAIAGTTGFSTNPGLTLGLRSADLSVTPSTTAHTVDMKQVDNTHVTATYYSGPNGVTTNPAEPALPLVSLNVTAPDATVTLRGVGFRGGTYSDSSVVPLTGAATTDLRGVHSAFSSPVFYPMKTWTTNYFDALGGGATRLLVTPAQHRSLGVASNESTLRLFSGMDFKLFYSGNISTYGGNTPALAAPPSVSDVDASPSSGGTSIHFRTHVVGDPSAGIQAVWVTYTGWDNTWRPLDLTQDPNDSTLWTGDLPLNGHTADQLRFMVQAVNGVGLVSLDDNLGSFYAGPGTSTVVPVATTLTLDATPTSGVYGSAATVHATLTGPGPLVNKPVSFTLGGATQVGTTGADGRATAVVPLTSTPGPKTLAASFAGDATSSSSSASRSFTVGKLGTAIAFGPAAGAPFGADSGVAATLTDGNGGLLLQRSVYFVVNGASGSWSTTAITDPFGVAHLGPIPLPVGHYTVAAYFSGSFTLKPSNIALALTDPDYDPSSKSIAFDIAALPSSITINNIPSGAVYGGSFTPAYTKTGDGATSTTSSTSTVCAVNATTGLVTFGGAGTCTLTSHIAAGPNYLAANGAAQSFQVKKAVSLGYTGNLSWSAGTGTTASVTLTGQVTAASTPAVALTNATVDFLIFTSTNTTTTPDVTCHGTVNASGVATCVTSLGLDNWTVIMRIPSTNAFFTAPDSYPVVLTVYHPVAGRYAVGAGWIADPSFQNKPVAVSATNNHGYFGFAVSYKADGKSPQGQVNYVFRGADGYDYLIKSTSWTGGGLAFGTTTSSFSGKASVVVINPVNGRVVSGLGGTAYTYRVDIVDGSADKFAISIYTSTGAVYHQAGTTASPIAVGMGAVLVH